MRAFAIKTKRGYIGYTGISGGSLRQAFLYPNKRDANKDSVRAKMDNEVVTIEIKEIKK